MSSVVLIQGQYRYLPICVLLDGTFTFIISYVLLQAIAVYSFLPADTIQISLFRAGPIAKRFKKSPILVLKSNTGPGRYIWKGKRH